MHLHLYHHLCLAQALDSGDQLILMQRWSCNGLACLFAPCYSLHKWCSPCFLDTPLCWQYCYILRWPFAPLRHIHPSTQLHFQQSFCDLSDKKLNVATWKSVSPEDLLCPWNRTGVRQLQQKHDSLDSFITNYQHYIPLAQGFLYIFCWEDGLMPHVCIAGSTFPSLTCPFCYRCTFLHLKPYWLWLINKNVWVKAPQYLSSLPHLFS